MIDPFELMKKYPPKLTWKEKVWETIITILWIGFIGLAVFGGYTLVKELF